MSTSGNAWPVFVDTKKIYKENRRMRELQLNERSNLMAIIFDTMTDNELVYLHNEAADNYHAWDDRIYSNEAYELNEAFSTIEEFARSSQYGSYDFNHDYFRFDGYGNIESFSSYDLHDYIDEDYIIDYIESDNFDEDSISKEALEYLKSLPKEEEEE
jgi:hypothetical protein